LNYVDLHLVNIPSLTLEHLQSVLGGNKNNISVTYFCLFYDAVLEKRLTGMDGHPISSRQNQYP
jgi:hypothetical protein